MESASEASPETVPVLTLPGFATQTSPVEGVGEGTCTPDEWERYGVLMDVDDLDAMRCSDFDKAVCTRCRQAQRCGAKEEACSMAGRELEVVRGILAKRGLVATIKCLEAELRRQSSGGGR